MPRLTYILARTPLWYEKRLGWENANDFLQNCWIFLHERKRRTQIFPESPEFEECLTSATFNNHSAWCQARTIFQRLMRRYRGVCLVLQVGRGSCLSWGFAWGQLCLICIAWDKKQVRHAAQCYCLGLSRFGQLQCVRLLVKRQSSEWGRWGNCHRSFPLRFHKAAPAFAGGWWEKETFFFFLYSFYPTCMFGDKRPKKKRNYLCGTKKYSIGARDLERNIWCGYVAVLARVTRTSLYLLAWS